MRRLLAAMLLAAAASLSTTAAAEAPWRDAVRAWASEHAQHSAWGVEHAERNYRLSLQLAAAEGLDVDADVLFAAAYLHDVGAIEPFRQDDVDHARRSVGLLPTVLLPTGFPEAKLADVEATILGHMFSADPGELPEARVFHDADTLDFLGPIGAARILSLVTRHAWATDIDTAAATLRGFTAQLPATLSTEAGRAVGRERAAELERFLDGLQAQLGKDPAR
ncbi:HD domain-containing protein [Luteimonas viscosa]|uniref:HD domain-containing protein n=1 Tax=Luteimonas viscosa TaxID=1132694 RepID=A0A5D4XT92_9GAMM|nr:HD domain-containing protein [Luteimonas viscosa]TYT27203.1 HD domain-containing protein [Luteimonas viscosa]